MQLSPDAVHSGSPIGLERSREPDAAGTPLNAPRELENRQSNTASSYVDHRHS